MEKNIKSRRKERLAAKARGWCVLRTKAVGKQAVVFKPCKMDHKVKSRSMMGSRRHLLLGQDGGIHANGPRTNCIHLNVTWSRHQWYDGCEARCHRERHSSAVVAPIPPKESFRRFESGQAYQFGSTEGTTGCRRQMCLFPLLFGIAGFVGAHENASGHDQAGAKPPLECQWLSEKRITKHCLGRGKTKMMIKLVVVWR